MPPKSPIDQFLTSKNSFTESGCTVRIEPKTGETVFLFNIDNPGARQLLGMPDDEPICDLVLYYASPDNSKKVICLVELKGSNLDHAAKQLISAYKYLKSRLNELIIDEYDLQVQEIELKGCIHIRGGSPRKNPQSENLLKQTFGAGYYRYLRNSDIGEFIRK